MIFDTFNFYTFQNILCRRFSADIDVIVNQIVFEEPLITDSKKPHLRRLIYSKLEFFSPSKKMLI